MKHKLTAFVDFAGKLYPHETDLLLGRSRFVKENNRAILQIIHHNSHHPENQLPFDQGIDKRVYSYIKGWITETLDHEEVDKFYEWLLATEKQVMTDSILPEEEKQIISFVRMITPSHYYFLKFYELLQYFRDFLLIRVRTRYHKITSNYLQAHQGSYQRSIAINNQLDRAAEEIIRQHETLDAEPIHFSAFLLDTFNDNTLDGYTRYRAAVRLTFLFYNYREFENLRSLYNALDKEFTNGAFYSKRVLANYYSNRAMMHSKLNELSLAEHYGYLSIRQKNSDYLFYLANLCGVLLRSKKYAKALTLMNESMPELKKTSSYYNKIGFVSFYIRTLIYNGKAKNAVSYATTFFEAYKKEIFETRWHLFFSAYAQALISASKYAKLLWLAKRYNLTEKEKKIIGTSVYMPILFWFTEVAQFMEDKQPREQLKNKIVESARRVMQNKYKAGKILELLDYLEESIPEIISEIKFELRQKE